jgi:hypothetical protein
MEIERFVAIRSRTHKGLEHAPLVRVAVGVLDKVVVQTDFSQHRALVDMGPEFIEFGGVTRRIPGVNAEDGQDIPASPCYLYIAQVGPYIHRGTDCEDAAALDLSYRLLQFILVEIQMCVCIHQHGQSPRSKILVPTGVATTANSVNTFVATGVATLLESLGIVLAPLP